MSVVYTKKVYVTVNDVVEVRLYRDGVKCSEKTIFQSIQHIFKKNTDEMKIMLVEGNKWADERIRVLRNNEQGMSR